VALAAVILTLRELPLALLRRRRWKQIEELNRFSVRSLVTSTEPPPFEVVVSGVPLSSPGVDGGADFYLRDASDPEARIRVMASVAPVIEHPGPDLDAVADAAGDAQLDHWDAPIYLVARPRFGSERSPEHGSVHNGAPSVIGLPLDETPEPPEWRLEPTLGPDGRPELVAFRRPEVPSQQARQALITLLAAVGVVGFAIYAFARFAWPSLVQSFVLLLGA
jgi:hypothetical protein